MGSWRLETKPSLFELWSQSVPGIFVLCCGRWSFVKLHKSSHFQTSSSPLPSLYWTWCCQRRSIDGASWPFVRINTQLFRSWRSCVGISHERVSVIDELYGGDRPLLSSSTTASVRAFTHPCSGFRNKDSHVFTERLFRPCFSGLCGGDLLWHWPTLLLLLIFAVGYGRSVIVLCQLSFDGL